MNKTLKFQIDLKVLAIALAAVIVAMLVLWQPWKATGETRKITVAGHSRIKAVPDFYRFNPSYQRTNSDRDAAIAELNAHVTSVTDKLKELGVKDDQIELQTNAYDQYRPEPLPMSEEEKAVTAHLTIKTDDKDLAQKIQNYLLTTSPQGTITPTPSFSDEKREQLEDEARDKAIADAKVQAERTARQLGAKLGRVLEVKDTVSGGIVPFGREMVAMDSAQSSGQSLPIFPGEQEISFSVEAIFEIK